MLFSGPYKTSFWLSFQEEYNNLYQLAQEEIKYSVA